MSPGAMGNGPCGPSHVTASVPQSSSRFDSTLHIA